MKKRSILALILAVLAILLFYDNFTGFKAYHCYTVFKGYGTNSDITDGALHPSVPRRYIFIFSDKSTVTVGSGTEKVFLKQRENYGYGIGSYLPFYKQMQPEWIFDCFLKDTLRYIGKIEINQKVVMGGIFNRKNMKKMITEAYIKEAAAILDQKAKMYSEGMLSPPFRDSTADLGWKENRFPSKLMVFLHAPQRGFVRRIPVRELGEVYVDSIHFPEQMKSPDQPFLEVYKVDKPRKKLFYSSYRADSVLLFSGVFTLDRVKEDRDRFHSYTIAVNDQ